MKKIPIATAAVLLLAISCGYSQELVQDPGFESGASKWKELYIPAESSDKGCTFTLSETEAHSGQLCAVFEATAPGARFALTPKNMPVAVKPGRYKLSAWVRAEENFKIDPGQSGMLIRISFYNGEDKNPVHAISVDWRGRVIEGSKSLGALSNSTMPKEWTQMSAEIEVPSDVDKLSLDVFYWRASGRLYVDDVSLEKI